MSLSAGQSLTHYEILGPLGAGGMGEVYRARDTRLGRDVALKVLPEASSGSADRRARFQREARAVARLNHPNIAQILDVGAAGGRDYIVFELVEGETLADRLAGTPLALEELVDLALPLADALSYAHAQGIVHRDLKPANVMLTRRGDPKVLDFGLAKWLEDDPGAGKEITSLTTEGAIFGTPAAMSPEQALGKPLDARSDVFSFGSLLYEMASRKPAFGGATAMEVLDAVIHADPPALSRARPELPAAFTAIVEKAQRKDPRERYQTMSDLAADLRHVRRSTAIGLVPPADARRRRVEPALAALFIVLVLGGATWWFLGRGAPSGDTGLTPDAAAPYVAVMGFENLSDPADSDALGRMLASLVSTDLAEYGGLRVVSTAKVRSCLEQVKPGAGTSFESAAAAVAARATGASVMLVGQILRQGSTILLAAELVDVASGETRGSLREEAASAEQVFALAGGLAASVRRHFAIERPGAGFDLGRSVTDSPEAYRQYSAGELAMHQRDFAVARDFFVRAVEIDPTFAMAWFRIGITSDWLNLEDGGAAFAKAIEHSGRLSPRWRKLCEAAAARLRGDNDTAFDALAPLVEAGTDIPEIYNELGEVLTHSSRHRDNAWARRCFARALDLDPSFEIVLYHLVNQTLQAGDLAGARALVERMTRAGRVSFGKLALLLAERRYADACAEAERQLAEHGDTDWEEYLVAARKRGDLDARDRAAELWAKARPGERNSYEWEAAMADFLRGRFAGITEHLDRAVAASTNPFHRSVGNLLRAQLAYGMGDPEAAATAARNVIDADPHEFEGWYWLGLSQLRTGRAEEAARTLETARDVLGRSRNAEGPGLLDSLEAVLVSASGDHARAREILARAGARPTEHRRRELENLALAIVAGAQGDFAAARTAWREVVEPRYVRHVMSSDLDVWPLYEIGRLEHDHGDPEAAREAFEEFLAHWDGADRPLPSITDARARLARLGPR